MKKSTRILIPALLLALAAGLLPACNKEAVQLAYDKQETNIANFVEAQRKTDKTARVTYKDGVVRVTMHDTLTREGLLADTLHTGGTVSFYYAGYTLTSASVSSSNLFATNHKKTADAAGWQLSDTTAFHIRWKASGTRTSAISSFRANMGTDPRPKARFLQGQPWFTTFG